MMLLERRVRGFRLVDLVALGLRELGGVDLRTRIIRSRVPYSVVTDATFPGIDDIGRRLIAHAGFIGSSTLEYDGNAAQWTLSVRDPHAEDAPGSEGVGELVLHLDSLRIVLTEGRFESGQGFTFENPNATRTCGCGHSFSA